MPHKPPPVPPDNRSSKGPGSDPKSKAGRDQAKPPEQENSAQQGDRANIRQNTTNPGYSRTGRRSG